MKEIKIITNDSWLESHRGAIEGRLNHYQYLSKQLPGSNQTLADYAQGYLYYGLHKQQDCWVLREWAPNATEIFLIGDCNSWSKSDDYAFKRINQAGDWELHLPLDKLTHYAEYRLHIFWAEGNGERLPAYVNRVVQNPETHGFNAQVWSPPKQFVWQNNAPLRPRELTVYEAHIGMALEEGRVGSYIEFANYILPKIVEAGYNTVQLMAIMEHPYYGSFGYQVSNFFAPSSRFGTPDELKYLVDTAHGLGLNVIMDLVHSHCVKNAVEGIALQDGTDYQYFHGGDKGLHPAWDSRCFNYAKYEVIHFLLSNCRYWLEEFKFDGYRFDGVTSMLYHDHGLGKSFTSYADYYGDNCDNDAIAYLSLANNVIHSVKPNAITIAEDMSGMPGIGLPCDDGGLGFDYRLCMGLPDMWIKLLKEVRDEDWDMGQIWHELINRRMGENSIAYAESHDQALVGDKTLIFRLIDAEMYTSMNKDSRSVVVDRGIAIHKLLRLITFTAGGEGYLNFMGNEFGHPEWIDFPREGNNWSYHYARRQWSLADADYLRYKGLAEFDKQMLGACTSVLSCTDTTLILEHIANQIISFKRGEFVFVFNFNGTQSFENFALPIGGEFELIFCTDELRFGGHGRVELPQYFGTISGTEILLYLPTRSALVLKEKNK